MDEKEYYCSFCGEELQSNQQVITDAYTGDIYCSVNCFLVFRADIYETLKEYIETNG